VKPSVDIVGHFGTTFSYATVASRVASALQELDLLGSVYNLDPSWHPAHATLKARPEGKGSHVFVVSLPQHYLDAYVGMYGRDNAAIFLSPNTDRLAVEYAKTTALFGLAVAPSLWCADVTERSLVEVGGDTEVVCAPLGVDESLLLSRNERVNRFRLRMDSGEGDSHTAVHLSTDQSWPGRKGTEELLEAWSLHQEYGHGDRLILHVPPALTALATYKVRELELDDTVEIRFGGSHGSDEGSLAAILDEADLLVAPSRCEGYGIMLASAIVAGVPLLCTCETGQVDFLMDLPGTWLGIPTGRPAELAGEDGLAPTVDPAVLAHHLRVALHPETLWSFTEQQLDNDYERHTWRRAAPRFASLLAEWAGRED
jgi:glycosyltransferase involved in cell wall biosynthesis